MTHPWTEFRLVAAAVAVALPLFSMALILALTRARPRLSAGISIGAICVSTVAAVVLLVRDWHLGTPVQYAGKWLVAGQFVLPFGFLFDPLNLLMFTVVALISLLVQVYSLGYMAGDPGFSRYYAFQSLFAWSMLSLTLSSSLLQLYIFWELVGISSYFLIGFWYERFSATQAGKKAFVMTRLGDTAFLIGILLLLANLGSLEILEITNPSAASALSPGVVTLTAILIFCAVIGKSAQFPLLTWLPDAMEGPTPVSALLHSATMVAAGVYLFARLFPFFSLSPAAMTVFLAVGTISMLMASTMAMVQRDIKQVWAYSTISQLGLMIMALGAGGLFPGVFHLAAHAGFKALLFLCSGVWIHHMATNDVFSIASRGARRHKWTMACLFVGGGALSGLPPFSGFFSKEAILFSLAGQSNPLWLGAGLLGGFLTSYYTFRMIFILLSGEVWDGENAMKPAARISYDAPLSGGVQESPLQDRSSERPQESGVEFSRKIPSSMAVPLLVLAGVTLLLGFFQGALARFLDPGLGTQAAAHSPRVLYLGLGAALLGLLVSWVEFGRRGAHRVGFVERVPGLETFFGERWFLDRVYGRAVRTVLDRTLAGLSWRNEQQVIDRNIERFCLFALRTGRGASLLQSGLLRVNLFFMFAVLVLVTLYFAFV